jgi:hypothetical protein
MPTNLELITGKIDPLIEPLVLLLRERGIDTYSLGEEVSE